MMQRRSEGRRNSLNNTIMYVKSIRSAFLQGQTRVPVLSRICCHGFRLAVPEDCLK